MEQQVLRTMVKKGYEVPTDPNWPKQWFLVSYMEHYTVRFGIQMVYRKAEDTNGYVKGVSALKNWGER